LNKRKKLSRSFVNNSYNDNGRRKQNFIKNQNNKENVFKSSNMMKTKNIKVSEIKNESNDTNNCKILLKKSILSSFLTTNNNGINNHNSRGQNHSA